MVDDDRYCVDVLTQIAAIRSALDAVGTLLITDRLDRCLFGHDAASEHACAKS